MRYLIILSRCLVRPTETADQAYQHRQGPPDHHMGECLWQICDRSGNDWKLRIATLMNHQFTSLQAGDRIHAEHNHIPAALATVMYDRITRKEWVRRAGIGLPVKIQIVSKTVDDDTVKQVVLQRQKWRSGQGHNPSPNDPNAKGNGKGAGKKRRGRRGAICLCRISAPPLLLLILVGRLGAESTSYCM